MTSTENYLGLLLVKEHYGDIARSICNHIVQKKYYPLILLASDLKLDKKIVAQTLSILVIHNILEVRLNPKQIIEYKFLTQNALNLLSISKNIAKSQQLYGNFAGLIVEQLYLHGSIEASLLILKILNTYSKSNNITDSVKINSLMNQIKDSFIQLVELNLIERCADLDESSKDSKIPKFKSIVAKFNIPELKLNDVKVKQCLDDTELDTKLQINEDFGDKDVYWKLNFKKFDQMRRDEFLIDAVRYRIDQNAANLINVVLRLSNSKIEGDRISLSNLVPLQVTSIDIQKHMRNDHKMDSITVEKYLTVIQQDSFKVLEKIGDFSGGAYSIDFKKSLHNFCVSHIESVIRERYGSKSVRIFKVILDKYQLEQKQIEEFSMIPSKDCKSLLYGMLNDGLLGITELSKANDHAPSRTYYLFYVDIYSICKKLLENAYKSMANLILKREFLTNENKRLIEKNKKLNTIIESLKSQGAEQAEIDEIKSMISDEEVKMLSSFNDHLTRIELAETQLEEAISLFGLYFYYNTIPPVIAPPRDRPLVFKTNVLTGPKWTLQSLVDVFKNEVFEFRIGKKFNGRIQFENECDYVDATIRDFLTWLNRSHEEKKPKISTPFDEYDINDYWAYADYKYMIELTRKNEPSIEENCVNWSNFGFENRTAKDSTLWIGSEKAYTPCHYDTYGYNLVAQVYGRKRWIMFSPEDSMYPTRVPFEESTVYSQVNIKSPDLKQFPLFSKTKPHVVDLEPGDVLYVPRHWWHYVESLSDSISVNTWVELEGADDVSRLKEALSKSLIQGLMESNFVNFESWMNSSEMYCEQAENMAQIQNCLDKIKSDIVTETETDYKSLLEKNEYFSHFVKQVSFSEYIEKFTIEPSEEQEHDERVLPFLKNLANSMTDSQVVDLIAQKLLQNSQ